jgi:hypothetical protein
LREEIDYEEASCGQSDLLAEAKDLLDGLDNTYALLVQQTKQGMI